MLTCETCPKAHFYHAWKSESSIKREKASSVNPINSAASTLDPERASVKPREEYCNKKERWWREASATTTGEEPSQEGSKATEGNGKTWLELHLIQKSRMHFTD